MQRIGDARKDWYVRWSVNVLVMILGVVVLRNAWLCDDAYISFRTVDNFVNGYGLTWNVAERVQAFTNPLWLLIISVFYLLTSEVYYTSIFLSLVATLSASWVLAKRISVTLESAGLAIVILISSKAFIDYSTSGLENPLSHLILALFAYVFLTRPPGLRTFLVLSILASLGMVNRMDLALFFLPALLYVYCKLPWKKGLLFGLVGLSPFLMWEAFSLIYYGFPFPNTYYAKLHAGIPKTELAIQGLLYFVDTLSLDPLTLIVIGAGLMLALASKVRPLLFLGGGVVLYMIYIVLIGGDFMSGRFFAAPLLVSVILIARLPITSNRSGLWVSVGAVLILSLTSGRAPLMNQVTYGTAGERKVNSRGISDERAWYYQTTGLLQVNRARIQPARPSASQIDSATGHVTKVVRSGSVGFSGYAAGANVHMLDYLGLADPLLGRLPVDRWSGWRVGHFVRSVPAGYFETLETGQNHIADTDLAEYYDHLTTLTRANLWSWHRLAEIFRFNVGWYDHLLLSHIDCWTTTVDYSEICVPRLPRTSWNAEGNIIIKPGGEVRVHLDSVCYYKCLEISTDHNDIYSVILMLDSVEIERSTIESISGFGLRVDTVEVSPVAYSKGYNVIRVVPRDGDSRYSLGHLLFVEDAVE